MRTIISEEQSLLEALARHYPDSSKSTLRSWLKQGRITVDGQIAKNASLVIKKGQSLTVESRKRSVGKGLRIIYEDRHLVAIDKPSGVLSVATAFDAEETAHAWLKAHYHPKRVHVVHRLDQDTSGVMLFALTEESRDRLKKTFHEHDLKRVYVAIVEGQFDAPKGRWQSHLYEDATYVVRPTPHPNKGRLAITHYEVVRSSPRYSWLELTLETGRKNQIRVHCQQAGHPVAGDKKYGALTDPIGRLCLHARLLACRHPLTGKAMRFESPSPASFSKILQPRKN